ncbi:MAG: hypothetical protein WDN47_04055 [Candidatus Doudnabacteria bacterium]
MRKIFVGAFWFLLIGVGWWLWRTNTWTPQRAEQEKTTAAIKTASSTAAGKSKELYSDMNAGFKKDGDVNTRELRDTVLPRAAKANEIRQTYEEALATADGKTIRQAPMFVNAMNPQWQGHIVFEGPLMVYGVTGYVDTDSGVGKFTSTPDGIKKADGLERFPLPLDDNQLHLALIGRVCHTATDCTEPFFIGSAKTFCPAQVGKTGWIEMKVNQNKSLIGGNTGGYSYNHQPAPSQACQ